MQSVLWIFINTKYCFRCTPLISKSCGISIFEICYVSECVLLGKCYIWVSEECVLLLNELFYKCQLYPVDWWSWVHLYPSLLIFCLLGLLLLFTCPVLSDSFRPHGLQHAKASLSLTISQSLPKFMFIALVIPCSHLILWHPLLLPSIFPSIRDFFNESSVHIRWPKHWSFSFSISPSWFDFFAVQETFRSLLQHHSLKVSILWCSAFLTVQLSQPYVTTRKTRAQTVRTFFGRMMSLLFNTLSRFVIAFLPRSNCFLTSRMQSLQSFWSPRRGNLSLLLSFPLRFAMQ